MCLSIEDTSLSATARQPPIPLVVCLPGEDANFSGKQLSTRANLGSKVGRHTRKCGEWNVALGSDEAAFFVVVSFELPGF